MSTVAGNIGHAGHAVLLWSCTPWWSLLAAIVCGPLLGLLFVGWLVWLFAHGVPVRDDERRPPT